MTQESWILPPRSRGRRCTSRSTAVAEEPGKAHNPLLVYGPSGAGRSHLLSAIYTTVSAAGELNVCAMSASELVEVTNREQTGLADVDVLLTDDFDDADQFAAVRETLDTLVQRGARVVAVAGLDGDARNELFSWVDYESGLAADCWPN